MKRSGQMGVDGGEWVRETDEPTHSDESTVARRASKFALFEGRRLAPTDSGCGIEADWTAGATFRVKGSGKEDNCSRPIKAPDHAAAVGVLMDWIEQRSRRDALIGSGIASCMVGEVITAAANYCGNGYGAEVPQSI